MTAAALAFVFLAPAADPAFPADEARFVRFAVDALFRDTWADPGPDAPPWSAAGVTAVVTARTAVAADLAQYLAAKHAPDELVRSVESYRAFLRTGTDLAAKLREREAKHLAFYSDLRDRLAAGEKARQADGNLAVLAAASDAVRGLMAADGAIPGESLFSGQAGNLIAARVLASAAENRVNGIRAEELEQARRDAAEFEKREGPMLAADLKALRAGFVADAVKLRPAPLADTDNPFAPLHALVEKPKPTTAAEIAAHQNLAAKCLAAIPAVPKPTGRHDPYRPFRAKLAAAAGSAAMAAAVASSPGGFVAAAKFRAANPAADLAVKAWAAYRTHDPNGKAFAGYQEALAHAAAGRTDAALRVVTAVGKDAGAAAGPAFWYDAARIASAAGRPDLGRAWLTTAVRAGFADADLARTDPDLDPVRRKAGPAFDALFAPTP